MVQVCAAPTCSALHHRSVTRTDVCRLGLRDGGACGYCTHGAHAVPTLDHLLLR